MKKEGSLRELNRVHVDESIRRKTNSTIFLLPALGLSKETLTKYGFVNAYIDDKGIKERYKNALFVLLEPEEFDSELSEFIEEQSSNPNFLVDYDVGKKQVMLVYRFPAEFINEYNNFRKGKYSKFSKKYVDSHFPMTRKEKKNGRVTEVDTVFAGIFHKKEWLKEYWEKKLNVDVLPNEYWSIPEDKKEIFRYESRI